MKRGVAIYVPKEKAAIYTDGGREGKDFEKK